jgi:hypothetical protein
VCAGRWSWVGEHGACRHSTGTHALWVLNLTICRPMPCCLQDGGCAPDGGAPADGTVPALPGELGATTKRWLKRSAPESKLRSCVSPWERRPRERRTQE